MNELAGVIEQYGIWAGLAIFFWYQQFQDKKALQKAMDDHYLETKKEIADLKEFQQNKMVEMIHDYNTSLAQCNQAMVENNEVMKENSNAMRKVCDAIALKHSGAGAGLG